MKKKGLIFDLDQTLIDSSLAEPYRKPSKWGGAYQQIPNFTEYEGISKVLSYLSEKSIPYCIVTSSPSTYCTKVCAFWKINNEHVICYHDTPSGQKKPHPAPILYALNKLQIDAKNALSFGDRDIDIISSNNAGVASVACLWGAADTELLLAANPTFTIKKPLEIIPLINKLFLL
jgi:phosphoglycolate phosphatase-like HAD superfamily hydrolase